MANPALEQLGQLMNLKGTQQGIQTQQFNMNQAQQKAQQDALVRDYLNRVSPQVSQAMTAPTRQGAMSNMQQLLADQPTPAGVDPEKFYGMINTAYGGAGTGTGSPFFKRIDLGDRVRLYTSPDEYQEFEKGASPSSGNYAGVPQVLGASKDNKWVRIWNPQLNRGGGGVTQVPMPEGGIRPVKDQPLPSTSQETLSQGLNAIQMLDAMEETVQDVTSDVPFWSALSGYGRKAGLKVGVSGDDEETFNTARDQFKLFAQSLIKGTPSNFDIKTVIDTLPDFTTKTSLAEKKIKQAQELFKGEVGKQIAFYTGTNKPVPPQLIQAARQLGVNLQEIEPSTNPWEEGEEEGGGGATALDYTDEQLDAALMETGGDVDAALNLLEGGSR